MYFTKGKEHLIFFDSCFTILYLKSNFKS